ANSTTSHRATSTTTETVPSGLRRAVRPSRRRGAARAIGTASGSAAVEAGLRSARSSTVGLLYNWGAERSSWSGGDPLRFPPLWPLPELSPAVGRQPRANSVLTRPTRGECGALAVPDARIEPGVAQVGEEITEHDDHAEQENVGLHLRVVTLQDRVE